MGMGMGMPFDENAMTIILGLGDPMEPGMHGEMKSPLPDKSAIDLISSIKDMCEEWLMKCGKCCDEPKPEASEMDMENKDDGEE